MYYEYTNWQDIGINDFPNMHTINFNDGLLQICPWDVIIDIPGTIVYIMIWIYFINLIRQFIKGYRDSLPRFFDSNFRE